MGAWGGEETNGEDWIRLERRGADWLELEIKPLKELTGRLGLASKTRAGLGHPSCQDGGPRPARVTEPGQHGSEKLRARPGYIRAKKRTPCRANGLRAAWTSINSILLWSKYFRNIVN